MARPFWEYAPPNWKQQQEIRRLKALLAAGEGEGGFPEEQADIEAAGGIGTYPGPLPPPQPPQPLTRGVGFTPGVTGPEEQGIFLGPDEELVLDEQGNLVRRLKRPPQPSTFQRIVQAAQASQDIAKGLGLGVARGAQDVFAPARAFLTGRYPTREEQQQAGEALAASGQMGQDIVRGFLPSELGGTFEPTGNALLDALMMSPAGGFTQGLGTAARMGATLGRSVVPGAVARGVEVARPIVAEQRGGVRLPKAPKGAKAPRSLEKVHAEFRAAVGEFESLPSRQRSLDRGIALQKKYQRLAQELETLKATEAPPPAPQPWEMTRAEFDKWYAETIGGKDIVDHKIRVGRAIQEGKPVPAEVLKDYPDLAKAAEAVAPQGVKHRYTPSQEAAFKEAKRISNQLEETMDEQQNILMEFKKKHPTGDVTPEYADKLRELANRQKALIEEGSKQTDVIGFNPHEEQFKNVEESANFWLGYSPAVPKVAEEVTLYRGEPIGVRPIKGPVPFTPDIEVAKGWAGREGRVVQITISREEFDKLPFQKLPDRIATYFAPQSIYEKAIPLAKAEAVAPVVEQLVYHAKTKGEFIGGKISTEIGSDSDILGKGFYFGTKTYAERYGTPEPYIITGKMAKQEEWVTTLRKYADKPIAEQREAARAELKAQGYSGVQTPEVGVVWDAEKIAVAPGAEKARPIVEAPMPPVAEAAPPITPPPAGAVPPVQPPSARGTLAEADDAISRFGKWLAAPGREAEWQNVQALRSEARAERIKLFSQLTDRYIGEGKTYEKAVELARNEAMSGKYPGLSTTISEDLAKEFRNSLFAKVYHTLQNEPFEQLSTVEALTNALLGKPIPRVPGGAGGSAYTRLMRVFGDQPEVMKLLDEVVSTKKSLERLIEEKIIGSGQPNRGWKDFTVPPSRPFGQPRLGEQPFVPRDIQDLRTPEQRAFAEMKLEAELARAEAPPADIKDFTVPPSRPFGQPRLGEQPFVPRDIQDLRTPEQRAFAKMKLEAELARAEAPHADIADFMSYPEIKSAFQGSMIPINHQHILVRAMKNAGWGVVDIGNLVRANVASLDQSFGRQVAPLIAAHPQKFAEAYVKAWAATLSDDFAKQAWTNLWKEPIMQFYDARGWDYLRPLTLPKGAPAYKSVEEFGFAIGGKRPIQKFTNMIPWVKFSQRGFVTGINDMTTAIMKDKYAELLRRNEKIASGSIKLKTGEAFDMGKELDKMAHFLEDVTGRGRLGPLKSLASVLNSFFFSARLNLGRAMSPRHLFSTSSMVRKEAWIDFGTFVASIVAIEQLGEALGAWEIGKHGWKAGKIKVGNTWIDPWAGYQQYARYANEMVTGVSTSATTGQEYPIDRLDLTQRFLLSKGAPLVSGARIAITGKKYTGEYFDPAKARHWTEQLAPFALQDISEAFENSGWLVGVISIPLAVSGMNLISATDKLNDLAQKEFEGRGLENLSPAEYGKVIHSKEGQQIQNELEEIGKLSPTQIQRKQDYAKQEQRSKDLGTWTGTGWSNAQRPDPANPGRTLLYPVKEWKEDLKTQQIQAAANWDTREALLGPRRDKIPKTGTKERARWDYYKLVDKYIEKDKEGKPVKGGKIVDMNGFIQAQDEFLAGLPPEQEKFILDNLGVNEDPLAQEFRRDKRVIKERFWGPMRATMRDDMENLRAEIEILKSQGRSLDAATLAAKNPRFAIYEDQQRGKSKLLRFQDPLVDELMVKWGYTGTFLNPTNKIRQLLTESGLPAQVPVEAGAR